MTSEQFPSEEEIAATLFNFSGDIYNLSDVLRFLNIIDISKPNNCRFLCWLVGLKLLPGERIKWIPSILQLGKYYSRSLDRYLEDFMFTPLDVIGGTVGRTIADCIKQRMNWFIRFAQNIGIDPILLEDAELRIQRIFAALCEDSKDFEFRPGYECFAMVSYLITLSFAKRGNLPLIFTEAIASHLCRSFTSILAFTNRLESLKVTNDYGEEQYATISRFCPEIFQRLSNTNLTYKSFIDKWSMNFFADEHCPLNLLLIWDHIIFHTNEYRQFMKYLYTAHLRQMIRAKIDFTSEESIYNMQWDAMAILEDTEEIKEQGKKSQYSQIYDILCPCINIFGQMFGFKSQ